MSSNPVHGKAYSIQYYVIKFVSDLWQVGGFLRVLRFPPPIKPPRYNWNIVESGIKHHKPYLNWIDQKLKMATTIELGLTNEPMRNMPTASSQKPFHIFKLIQPQMELRWTSTKLCDFGADLKSKMAVAVFWGISDFFTFLVWSKDELNPWPFTLELNTSEKVIGYVWWTPCCDKSLHGYWPCDHEILSITGSPTLN